MVSLNLCDMIHSLKLTPKISMRPQQALCIRQSLKDKSRLPLFLGVQVRRTCSSGYSQAASNKRCPSLKNRKTMGIVTSDCPSPDIANNRLDSAELSLLLSEKLSLSVHGPFYNVKRYVLLIYCLKLLILVDHLFFTHFQEIIII